MSTTDKTFTWTSPDGITVTVPRLGRIEAGVYEDMPTEVTELDQIMYLVRSTCDESTHQAVRKLPRDDLSAFSAAWQLDDVRLGESSSSSA